MKTFDVVGIGAHNIDLLKKGKETIVAAGGAAGNTMTGLSKLGMRCGIQGRIGSDGQILLENFRQYNVDYSLLAQDDSVQAGYGYVSIADDGEREIFYNSGANNTLKKKDISLPYLLDSRWIHLSSFVDEKQSHLLFWLAEQVNRSVRTSFWVDEQVLQFGIKQFERIIPFVHTIFIKDSVLVYLTQSGSMEGARKLLEKGTQTVAVMYSPHDSSIFTSKEEVHIHTPKEEIIDATGASCAFAAGYIYGQLKKQDIRSSGFLGHAAMSVSVEKIGSRTSLPTYAELQKRNQEILRKVL